MWNENAERQLRVAQALCELQGRQPFTQSITQMDQSTNVVHIWPGASLITRREADRLLPALASALCNDLLPSGRRDYLGHGRDTGRLAEVAEFDLEGTLASRNAEVDLSGTLVDFFDDED